MLPDMLTQDHGQFLRVYTEALHDLWICVRCIHETDGPVSCIKARDRSRGHHRGAIECQHLRGGGEPNIVDNQVLCRHGSVDARINREGDISLQARQSVNNNTRNRCQAQICNPKFQRILALQHRRLGCQRAKAESFLHDTERHLPERTPD